jgi:hypothetical protein
LEVIDVSKQPPKAVTRRRGERKNQSKILSPSGGHEPRGEHTLRSALNTPRASKSISNGRAHDQLVPSRSLAMSKSESFENGLVAYFYIFSRMSEEKKNSKRQRRSGTQTTTAITRKRRRRPSHGGRAGDHRQGMLGFQYADMRRRTSDGGRQRRRIQETLEN